jgi:hypothetical protein
MKTIPALSIAILALGRVVKKIQTINTSYRIRKPEGYCGQENYYAIPTS